MHEDPPYPSVRDFLSSLDSSISIIIVVGGFKTESIVFGGIKTTTLALHCRRLMGIHNNDTENTSSSLYMPA
jgi:hypothetical protein